MSRSQSNCTQPGIHLAESIPLPLRWAASPQRLGGLHELTNAGRAEAVLRIELACDDRISLDGAWVVKQSLASLCECFQT